MSLMIVSLIFLIGCGGKPSGDLIKIQDAGFLTIEQCQVRGLQDKVLMIESKYCSHCEATLPDFIQACAEKGVEPEILDVSVSKNRQKVYSYGLDYVYTPTFVFGCNYYIGAMPKTQYLSLLDKFLASQN